MRESFVVHAEYIEDLPEELKSTFLRYVYDYGINGIEPGVSGLELTVWTKIKRRIDEDTAAYDRKVANLKQNRHRTETNKANTEIKKDRTETVQNKDVSNGDRTETDKKNIETTENRTDSVSVNVNEYVNESVIDSVSVSNPPKADTRKTKRFSKPSCEEIREYCFEKNVNIDVDRFFNYYESKGWKVGNAPMKDWKAAVRNWAKNDLQYHSNVKPNAIQSDRDSAVLQNYMPEEKETDITANLAEIQGVNTNGIIQSEEEIIY